MSTDEVHAAAARRDDTGPAGAPPAGAPDARTATRWRRSGYRFFGEGFSYLLHMRPAEWPIMVAHTALGFLLATSFRPGALGASWWDLALGLFLWVVLLNGGTLAINSAYDRDTGDIGYLKAPPAPPRHLASFSFALMLVGQLLAFRLGFAFAAVYAVCFFMSVIYSVPPLRLKAVAGADWVINMIGFGTLTPYAGWAMSGRPLEGWAALLLIGFTPLFAALYPLTQLYQFDEDRARGDRTLALVLGMRPSLVSALVATLLAFAFFGAAAWLGPANALWPLLLVALAAWLLVLVPWLRRHQHMTPAQHQRGMYAALHAWAVTDVAVLLVFAL
jgi:lycopene elongase/hydratase (dihydrobisanhydrobacterioruberin-forming)